MREHSIPPRVARKIARLYAPVPEQWRSALLRAVPSRLSVPASIHKRCAGNLEIILGVTHSARVRSRLDVHMMDRLHELAVRNRRLRAVNIELEHLLGVSVPSALVQDLAALDSASFDHFFAVCSASMNASGRAPPSEREARRLYAACTTSRAESEADVCNTSAVGEPSLSGDERIHSTEGRRADPHDSLGRDPCPPVAMRRGSFESTLASVPTASYRSLQRSSRTIEDFCKTYLPFLELHWQDVIFQIMPILVYVESTIYQIDEANELAPSVHGVCTRRGGESEGDSGGLSTEAQDIWDTLIKVLKEQGLWTPQIAGEMRCGLEYWRLERRLKASAPEPQPLPPSHTAQGHVNDACGDPCGPVCTLHAQAAGSGGQLVLTEKLIQDAVGHKSFDYRVLNLVLHRLLKKAPASTHLAFLRCSELLTEVALGRARTFFFLCSVIGSPCLTFTPARILCANRSRTT